MCRGLVIAMMALNAAAGAQELNLPDPLVMQDGRRVTSAEMWTNERRPEVFDLFRENVYGRVPKRDTTSTGEIMSQIESDGLRRKNIVLKFQGPGGEIAVRLYLVLPPGKHDRLPVFLLINHRDDQTFNPEAEFDSGFWPAKQIVARGYATAILQAQDIDPDSFDEFKNGVHGIYDDPSTPRAGDAWGTIAAWAWGASRALDYFVTDSDVDATKVAVLGHSRGGKTALWCGARDERFALVISNESGCTGAALSRRPVGETVKNINDKFPHWFCANYRQYNDREAELPVDQHELIALMAPRLVYVSSATLDTWADPEGEFLACVHASPVYELFGVPGLGTSTFPAPDSPIQTGRIGYHLRTGKHELTAYDWNQFMNFADKHWK